MAVLLVVALLAGCVGADDPDGDGPAVAATTTAATTTPSPATGPSVAPSPAPSPEPSPSPAVTPTPVPTPSLATDPAVQALVAQLDDDQLAAQLLVVTFRGTAPPTGMIEELQPGGVILMGHNTRGPDGRSTAVPALVAGLQDHAEIPLLVAIDQEQGPVARLADPFTRFPSAMAIGATGDIVLARRTAAAVGSELATAGINVNLAPVADLNTEPRNPVIGTRSPGQAALPAGALVAAQVRGLQDDAGISAAVKHFPGHGDTTQDSHTALPTVTGALAELRTTALVPFEAAVRAGVDVVMPGHLLLADVDPTKPATLSSVLLQDVLRDELGFEGIVLSDSMQMAAIRGDDPATAVAALQAGVDLVLMPPDAIATRDAIVAAMVDGTLDRDRVVRSVERVLHAKARRGLLEPGGERPTLPGPALLADHAALATEVATRAVTVVRGACPEALAGTTVTVDGPGSALLVDALAAEGVAVAPGSGQRVTLWDGRGTAPAADGAILVVTGSPYAVGRVGAAATVLATFDATAAAFRGVARALASGTVTGRSPVSIPRSDAAPLPVGHGIRCTPGT